MDGSWSGFADDLFIKDEPPDHTAESAKYVILNNAEHVGRRPAQAKLLLMGDRAEHPQTWGAKTAHFTGPVSKDSG